MRCLVIQSFFLNSAADWKLKVGPHSEKVTSLFFFFQLDDGPAVLCGAAGGSAALQDLSEGAHRLIVTTTASGDPNPIAVGSTLLTVGE